MSDTYIILKDTPITKAGTEFTWDEKNIYYKTGNGYSCEIYYKKDVENNPTWFKKKEQPQWEILSYKCFQEIFSKNKHGLFESNGCAIKNMTGAEIHSVKRLSDGEVFTIGDVIDLSAMYFQYKIEGFEISSYNVNKIPILWVRGRQIKDKSPCAYTIDAIQKSNPQPSEQEKDNFWTDELVHEYVNNHNQYGHTGIIAMLNFKESKLNPNNTKEEIKPLFKTSDGKDMYIMDVYFTVSDEFYLGMSNAHPSTLDEVLTYLPRTFSTKEKAQEYITLNKPCLSAAQVLKLTSVYGKDFVPLENDIINIAKLLTKTS